MSIFLISSQNPGPENTWIFSEMLSVSTKHRSDKQNYWRSMHSYWENVLVYHSSCAPVFTRIPTPWSCWPKINTKQTWLIMLAFSSPVVCTGWRVICFHLNGINVYRRVTKGDLCTIFKINSQLRPFGPSLLAPAPREHNIY